jgi:cyclophilin family peptidyl-prolyl cis-trans isomerase/HEAT repeat protein
MLLLILSLALAEAPSTSELDLIWSLEASRSAPSAFDHVAAHEDGSVRARAALALGRLRDPRALPLLQTLVQDPEPAVRQNAAFGLGLTAGGGPIALTQLATEVDPGTRARLCDAVGLQGVQDAVPALTAALDESAQVSRAASIALGRLAMAKTPGVDDDVVTDALLRQLQVRMLAPDARSAAGFALARIAPTPTDPVLRDAMYHRATHDRDPEIRAFLIRALAADLSPDELVALSKDGDRGVRVAVARALPKSSAPDTVVARLLDDPAWDVQVAAMQSVGSIDTLDHEALLTPLTSEGHAEDVRAAAIAALGSAGVTAALRPFLKEDQPDALRRAAILGLDDLAQLERLLGGLESPVLRSAVAQRLSELGGPDQAALLLADADPILVAVGLSMLAEDPAPEQLEAVLEALAAHPADMDVQIEGLKALDASLTTLPARQPAPASAAAVVDQALRSTSPAVRSKARAPAAQLGLSIPDGPGTMLPARSDVDAIVSARILTDAGELRVALHTDVAPLTVWNFAQLAEQDYFDGLRFHRVVPDFVIQDGCPRGDGWGGPGYAIPDELSWLPYDRGALGMALSGPDTGGSQWFVTLSDQPHLEAGYTLFGHVTDGWGTLQSVHQGTVIRDVVIERVP